jgi:hypothetical protein
METEIQRIRELERSISQDLKNSNNIVEIRKVAESNENHKDVRVAAIHSLRRIFIDFAENDKIVKPTQGSKNKAVEKFYSWFVTQYQEYEKLLCAVIRDEQKEWAHEVAVRTLLEVSQLLYNILCDNLFLFLGFSW